MKLSDALTFGTRLYYNRYEDDRRVTFSDVPNGTLPRQRRVWDERQHGLLSTLTWQASPTLTVEGGLNYEQQDNGYIRERYAYAEPTDFRQPPARVQNNDRHSFDNWGAYVHHQPVEASCRPIASTASAAAPTW